MWRHYSSIFCSAAIRKACIARQFATSPSDVRSSRLIDLADRCLPPFRCDTLTASLQVPLPGLPKLIDHLSGIVPGIMRIPPLFNGERDDNVGHSKTSAPPRLNRSETPPIARKAPHEQVHVFRIRMRQKRFALY